MGKFLISMTDGRIVVRNEETDAHINLKPVSDEIVDMVTRGEVTPRDVISAITAKMREDGSELSADEYYKEKAKLNVRRSGRENPNTSGSLRDRSDEEVSVSAIMDARSREGEDEKAVRKERIKKVNKALEADNPLVGIC